MVSESKLQIATGPLDNLTEEEILELYKSPFKKIKLAVLSNPTCPSNILLKAVNSKSRDIQSILASHKNSPQSILVKLSQSEFWDVRELVALNENTPPEILGILSKDDCYCVQKAVARNKNTPVQYLAELSKVEDWLVRESVALNPNCPDSVLLEMAKIEVDWKVKRAIVRNNNCPKEVLKMLADDSDVNLLVEISQNPNCDEEIFSKLIEKSWEVRYNVALNYNCPKKILFKLFHDTDSRVRFAAAKSISDSSNQKIVFDYLQGAVEYIYMFECFSNITAIAEELKKLKLTEKEEIKASVKKICEKIQNLLEYYLTTEEN